MRKVSKRVLSVALAMVLVIGFVFTGMPAFDFTVFASELPAIDPTTGILNVENTNKDMVLIKVNFAHNGQPLEGAEAGYIFAEQKEFVEWFDLKAYGLGALNQYKTVNGVEVLIKRPTALHAIIMLHENELVNNQHGVPESELKTLDDFFQIENGVITKFWGNATSSTALLINDTFPCVEGGEKATPDKILLEDNLVLTVGTFNNNSFKETGEFLYFNSNNNTVIEAGTATEFNLQGTKISEVMVNGSASKTGDDLLPNVWERLTIGYATQIDMAHGTFVEIKAKDIDTVNSTVSVKIPTAGYYYIMAYDKNHGKDNAVFAPAVIPIQVMGEADFAIAKARTLRESQIRSEFRDNVDYQENLYTATEFSKLIKARDNAINSLRYENTVESIMAVTPDYPIYPTVMTIVQQAEIAQAKTVKIAEVQGKFQTDYSVSEYTDKNFRIIMNEKATIVDEIQDIKNIEDVAIFIPKYPTAISKLPLTINREEKDAMKKEVADYLDITEYRASDKAEIAEIIASAENFIDATATENRTANVGNVKKVFDKVDETKTLLFGIETDYDLTQIENGWVNFRGNSENMAVVDYDFSTSEKESELLWKKKYGSWMGGSPSVQIIVDDALIFVSSKTIIKLDLLTGEPVRNEKGEAVEGTMVESSNWGYTPPIYARGMIICGLANGTVQAFDAETLESLWVYTDPLGGQSLTPIAYSDGNIYTGFWNLEEGDANYVCINIEDENKNSTNEEKIATWSHTNKGGYYWTGALVVGDYLVVGSDNGEREFAEEDINANSTLFVFNKYTGAVEHSYQISGDQRSGIAYESGNIYFTTKNGYIHKGAINENTGAITNLKSVKAPFGSELTSTPVVFDGRMYLGGGSGVGSGGAVMVLDANNLTEIYRASMPGYGQGSILLSTVDYKKPGDDVYIYSTYNSYPGGISMLVDNKNITSNEKSEMVDIYIPESADQNYGITSIIGSGNGVLYYKNDSGNVFAVGNKTANSDVGEVIPIKENHIVLSSIMAEMKSNGMKIVTADLSAVGYITRDILEMQQKTGKDLVLKFKQGQVLITAEMAKSIDYEEVNYDFDQLIQLFGADIAIDTVPIPMPEKTEVEATHEEYINTKLINITLITLAVAAGAGVVATATVLTIQKKRRKVSNIDKNKN